MTPDELAAIKAAPADTTFRDVVALVAEIERLRFELDDASEQLRLHQTLGDYETGYRTGVLAANTAIEEIRKVTERFKAENAQVREALKPFADYGNWDGADEFEPQTGRRMDYVDAARVALGQPVSA